jgi:hypothetical protein
MTVPECPRESDVIGAVIAGRWRDHGDDTLQAHVAQCEVCKELVDVASLLRLERDALHDEITVPGAGQVWWRAAIRARLEASQQVSRPFSWIVSIAVACVVGLTVAVVEMLWSPAQSVLRSATIPGWTTSFGLGEIIRWLSSLTDLTSFATTGVFVLLGATACLLLAPLALYFALSDE